MEGINPKEVVKELEILKFHLDDMRFREENPNAIQVLEDAIALIENGNI